jgi:hypothetical protein
MEHMGERLSKIRRRWKLSLRGVEERGHGYPQKWNNESYQILASWLNRVEREKHELSVKSLIVLADTPYRCKLMIRLLRIDR